MKKPSETERGKRWLENFAALDVPQARLLVDSLYIPSTDEIRQSIKIAIQSISEGKVQPSLLLPVLSIEDIRNARERNNPDLSHAELRKPPIAYVDFHPGSDILATPGSEAMIGNVLRDLTGDKPGSMKNGWLHPASTLEALRDQRCRSIILVTDYAGSGTQIVRYARFLTRNHTLRSWRSLQYLRIFVVMHAASPQAISKIRASSDIDDYHFSEIAPSFSTAEWAPEERMKVESLCKTYSSGEEVLGYKGSAGLMAMHSGIPNNLPMVLRKSGANWNSFFDDRTFPPDLAAEMTSYRPDRDLASVAKSIQQTRLAEVITSGRLGTTASQVAAALALISRSTCDSDALAMSLGVSSDRAKAIWKFLDESGMISGATLTQRGIRELKHAKALPRKTRVSLGAKNEEPYYPKNLR